MNFLSEENKKTIKREYFRRLFIVIGLFSFGAILIGVVLLLPSSFFLKSQKENLKRLLVISEERFSRSKTENIIPIVEKLNVKISLLSSGQKNIEEKSAIIKSILEEKTSKIKINDFFLEKGKVSIQGLSDSREDLLAFIASLKNKKYFKKVESPVSNLIKEKNIEFIISIEL